MTEQHESFNLLSLNRRPAAKLIGAIGIALLHCAASYWLLRSIDDTALISISFLLVQPAAVTAFACYVSDLDATRDRRTYTLMPAWLTGLACVLAFLFFHEGVICAIMLAPIWLVSGSIGAQLTYRMRKRMPPSEVFAAGFLALPFVMMIVEPAIPRDWNAYTVTRSIDIAAPASRIWPMMQGIPDVRLIEGRWTIAQSVFGVPRPLSARLLGTGTGAWRDARWQHNVHFREVIDRWKPKSEIGWRFDFTGSGGWDFTDPHLRPGSSYFTVTDGGYTLSPAAQGHLRLTLWTRYRVRTPVNPYAAAWGEILLGGISDNLLGIIHDRAEANR